MMLKIRQSILMFVIAASVLAGCSKKSTEPAETQPKFPVFTLTSPAAASDTCGGPAYAYVTQIRALLQSSAIFAILPGQNVNGVWTWQFPVDGMTIKLTSQLQSNGTYQWLLLWNGTDTTTQVTYTNWKSLEGNSSADGKSGTMTIYDDTDPTSQTILMSISWTTQASGTLEATIDYYSGGDPSTRIILVSNANGSGEITEFTWTGAWVPTGYHATWTGEGATAVCS
ncbi:MAG: hypothetical protein WEB33_12955 [Bacteroidota bacterium]